MLNKGNTWICTQIHVHSYIGPEVMVQIVTKEVFQNNISHIQGAVMNFNIAMGCLTHP